MIDDIEKEISGKKLTLPQIIKIAKDFTNKKLYFSSEKVNSNPNLSTKSGKANCIGYSALFSSVFNYIVGKQEYKSNFKMKHLVGQIDFLGIDVHTYFNSSFFKDHDFNEIINLKTGEREYIDPSLSDYFFIDRVSVREN